MRRLFELALCLATALLLCACSSAEKPQSSSPKAEPSPVQNNYINSELVFSETFACSGDSYLMLELFPQSRSCRVYDSQLIYSGPYEQGTDGQITVSGDGVELSFRRKSAGLVAERCVLNGENDPAITGSKFAMLDCISVRSGIYMTAEGGAFEEMQMELNLDDMSYVLNGSTGRIEFSEDLILLKNDESSFAMYAVKESGWQGLRCRNSKPVSGSAAPASTMYLYGYDPDSGTPGPRQDVNYVADPHELENVSERSYRWSTMKDGKFFHVDLKLYGDYCEIMSIGGPEDHEDLYRDDYFKAAYTETADGRICVDADGQSFVFTVPEDFDPARGYTLVLESGSIVAGSSDYGGSLPPEQTEYMQVEAGAEFLLMYALDSSGDEAAETAVQESLPDFIYIGSENAADQTPQTEEAGPEFLVFEEQYSYYFKNEEDGLDYSSTLWLHPASSYFRLSVGDLFYTGEYSEVNGKVCIEAFGDEICFRRGIKGQLIYESGPLMAAAEKPSGTDHAEQPREYVELTPGDEFKNISRSTVSDGIYVLDTSLYEYEFNEVLLDIDLEEKRFALRCYDGSLAEGELLFERDTMICQFEEGRLFLSPQNSDGDRIYIWNSNAHQLLCYPQPNGQGAPEFIYDRERKEELSALDGAVSLNDLKIPVQEHYVFYSPRLSAADSIYNDTYGLTVSHNVASDTWEFYAHYDGGTYPLPVQAEESEDGNIVFSHEGKAWLFHRENGRLIYDGGDIIALGDPEFLDTWPASDKPAYELQPGDCFDCEIYACMYETDYFIPASTDNRKYITAMHLDYEKGHVVLNYEDELIVQGLFSYTDAFRLVLDLGTIYIVPSDEYDCALINAMTFDHEKGIVIVYSGETRLISGKFSYTDDSLIRIDFRAGPDYLFFDSCSIQGICLDTLSRFMTHQGVSDYFLHDIYPTRDTELFFIPMPVTEKLSEDFIPG